MYFLGCGLLYGRKDTFLEITHTENGPMSMRWTRKWPSLFFIGGEDGQ